MRLTRLRKENTIKLIVVFLFILVSLISSLNLVLRGEKDFFGKKYTHYNNYQIFKYSFEHLKEGKDLHVHYLDQHLDLYKYTPGFAVFFGLFYYMPDYLGMPLWNLLNSLVLLFAIYSLPFLTDKSKLIISILLMFELITSLLNVQSNALIAGSIILAFSLLERKQLFWAVSLIMFATFTKIFSIVAFALFIFYPHKLRQFAYGVFWLIFWLTIPLLFVDFETNLEMLSNYIRMLQNEVPTKETFSLHRLIEVILGIHIDKFLFSFLGGLMILIPLFKVSCYKIYEFRLLYMAVILMWLVIFNYRAESPTYIIAVSGVLIWFVIQSGNWFSYLMLVLTFVLTTLSLTDIVPATVREEYVRAYAIKAIPVSIIWFIATYQLFLIGKDGKVKEIKSIKQIS